MSVRVRALLIVVLAAVVVPRVDADQVRMRDGSILTGTIRERTPTEIVIATEFGELRIPRSDVRPDSVQVFLRGGGVVEGELIEVGSDQVTLGSSIGMLTIDLVYVDRVVRSGSRVYGRESGWLSEGFSLLGPVKRAEIYDAKKRSTGRALALQALGGGLLYAERDWPDLGILALLAENGLLTAAVLTHNPRYQPTDYSLYMVVGGLALKAVDAAIAIGAVKTFNLRLEDRLGMRFGYGTPGPRRRANPITRGLAFELSGAQFHHRKHELGSYGYTETDAVWGLGLDYRFGRAETHFAVAVSAQAYSAHQRVYRFRDGLPPEVTSPTELLTTSYLSSCWRARPSRNSSLDLRCGVGGAIDTRVNGGGVLVAETVAGLGPLRITWRHHFWFGRAIRRAYGPGLSAVSLGCCILGN